MLFIHSLRDAMFSSRFPYSGTIYLETGKYYPFSSENICKNKCCRYRIFEKEIGAHFLCWRRQIEHYWFYNSGKVFTKEEEETLKKERLESLRIKEKEQKKATETAKSEWENATNVDLKHLYIIKKSIIPYKSKSFKNKVILPIYNENMEVISNQKITPDFKMIAKGTSYKNGFLILSDFITNNILFCEGWATGCTLQEVSNQTVIVAFNSSNIPNVASIFRKKLPHSHFLFCADKDQHQIGQMYAIKGATENGGSVIVPDFQSIHEPHYTDFNDVHVLYGKEEVYKQIYSHLI